MSASPVADLGLGHIRLEEARPPSNVSGLGAEYGAAAGLHPLREALARWQGAEVDEVAVTTGASLGLVATLATLPNGSSILLPRPCYPAYPRIAAALGLRVLTYELDPARRWQPSVAAIAAARRADTSALVLDRPSNPTGAVADESVLQGIERLRASSGLLLVVDETYGGLEFDDASGPRPASVFERSGVVRVLSFSKLFGMPGERLGAVVADPARVREITRAHWALAMSPPATAQLIALAALRADPDRHIARLRRVLARHRDRALELLTGCDAIQVVPPAGGCFLWLAIRDCPLDSRGFAELCARRGVTVMPGEAFGAQKPTYVRISFAVPPDELEAGLRRLVETVRSLRPQAGARPTTAAIARATA